MRRPTRLALALALLGCETSPTAPTADARAVIDAPTDARAPSDASIDPRDVITPLDASPPPRDASGPDGYVPFDVGTAANTTCATAIPFTPGILGDVPAHLGAQPTACSGGRPALWYSVPVPAGHRVVAQVVSLNTDNVPVAVALTRGCDPACLATGTFSAGWTNEGPDADIRVAVWTQRETFDGRLQLSVGVQPPVSNGTCAGAESLGVSVFGEVTRSLTPPPACIARPAWRTIFFRATVPPGATLAVMQRENLLAAQGFAILDGCGATDCLAVATPPQGAAATLRYTNTLATPREVIVAAATDPATPDGHDVQVSADARVIPAAENVTCASAAVMRDGDARDNELPAASAAPAPACGIAGPESNALFYAVRVGAGEQLAVAAESSSVPARVRVFDGCDATTCLATRAGASRAVASWENTGTAARDLAVAVSLEAPMSLDPVRVHVGSRVVPYRVTRQVADCDDMTGAAPWTTSTSFLGSTERRSVPLPFAFPWFGRAMRHLVPSYGALAELWPDAHVSNSDGAGGGALPIPTQRDAVVPFFDRIVTSPPPAVSTRAFAGPPGRFTVQWSEVFLAGNTDGPLTFQAKLFEDGAVEFHYCSMGATAQGAGSEAAIGVQGGDGPFARMHAYRQAGAARAGDALRFAP